MHPPVILSKNNRSRRLFFGETGLWLYKFSSCEICLRNLRYITTYLLGACSVFSARVGRVGLTGPDRPAWPAEKVLNYYIISVNQPNWKYCSDACHSISVLSNGEIIQSADPLPTSLNATFLAPLFYHVIDSWAGRLLFLCGHFE